ncbi:alpha/beta hydrolase-fold protein [Cellulophaga baltica]|uniref:alpha/beta hydrolase n=1 Tax=Cellulophaga baltica TaxID=76594 RepID=UPI002148FAAB|nr:alpha/beta hydrolase-fold protein [Cellulophaga baltica]MCR1026732.1 alpha/beta hydrolase-fold protein [Cellulophaga baltica]
MNLKILSFVLFLTINFIFGQDYGKTETIKLNSKELNQQREIFVYTPSYYEENIFQYYNVIYVFDAQTKEFFDLTRSLLPFVSKEIDNPYIVVGLTSTYDEKLNYGRNDDLLPKPINVKDNNFFGKGNSENYLKYLLKEVIPYIDTNYKTLSTKIGIGHSLSASFLISSLLRKENPFNAYIAISPNLTYDKDRLANEFINFKFTELEEEKFLYISNADEGISSWKSWKPARELVYNFLNTEKPNNIEFRIDSLPNKNHWTTFVPSLINGMTSYFEYIENQPINKYQTKIEVKVPNENDEVFISGNQDTLGNWEDDKVKMEKSSKFERTITLELKSVSQIRFTRGSAEKEAVLKNFDLEYLYYIPISPSKSQEYFFEIINWKDRMKKN